MVEKMRNMTFRQEHLVFIAQLINFGILLFTPFWMSHININTSRCVWVYFDGLSGTSVSVKPEHFWNLYHASHRLHNPLLSVHTGPAGASWCNRRKGTFSSWRSHREPRPSALELQLITCKHPVFLEETDRASRVRLCFRDRPCWLRLNKKV